MIDPMTLRLFVTVLEQGTIASAAASEHIAASAVSMRLNQLEKQMRAPLLIRSNRGVEPTDAGRRLLRLSRSVLSQLDLLKLEMSEHQSSGKKCVRVVTCIDATTELLCADLKKLSIEFPDLRVELEQADNAAVVKAVAEHQADLGIFSRGVPALGLEMQPYRVQELAVMVPLDHSLSGRQSLRSDEVVQYDIVGTDSASIRAHLRRTADETGMTIRTLAKATGYDAVFRMVSAGLGIAVVPRESIEWFGGAEGVATIRLDEGWAKQELMICHHGCDSLAEETLMVLDHFSVGGARGFSSGRDSVRGESQRTSSNRGTVASATTSDDQDPEYRDELSSTGSVERSSRQNDRS